jgi:NAD(P)-dependent dehydrogenase (short-subunit alcohol dehydrogenase family)
MKLHPELQFIENFRKPRKSTDARMDGKTCVITGATSGVGLAAAKRLAKGGANLILVCRNAVKAKKVQSEIQQNFSVKVDLVMADFADLDQVRQAAATILNHHPCIEVLINNAGLHNNQRTLTPAGHELVFCVNHLAPFLFTRLLLDRLIACAPTRIIQVNSQGHRFGGLDLDDLTWKKRRYNGYRGYGASKIAQLLTTWEFSDMLEGTGVTINAVHPGAVTTNIGMNNGWLFRWYQRLIIFPLLPGPESSGEVLYYFAAAPELDQVSGQFFNQTNQEIPSARVGALDRQLGSRVWQISEQLTGLASIEEDNR